MFKNITFKIDTDLYEKFNAALIHSGEGIDDAGNACISWYITHVYSNKSNNIEKNFYGMALHRIPLWAMKKNQYNHKIIKAYFMATHIAGEATVSMMKKLCSDKERMDLYVPTFKNNYSQMKFDGSKSHGKVFEDDGKFVWIWNEVEETLMKYKKYFYTEE